METDVALIAAAAINATLSPASSGESFSPHEQNTSSPAYRPYNERLETYLVPIVFMFIFVTGAIGNITLIHVLVKEKMLRSPSHLYILNLSLGDLIVILGTVPFVGTIYTFESWPYGLIVCKASEFIRDVSIGVSVMTLSAMSVDRYRAAFATTMIRATGKSYGAYSMYSSLRSRTGFVMLMIWITAFILASPSAYFSYILKFPIPDGSGYVAVCYPFPSELLPWYPKVVVMAKCIILYIIPLTIIACCYVSIASHLISKSQSNPSSSALAALASCQQSPPTIKTQVAPSGISNSVTIASHTVPPSNTTIKACLMKQSKLEVPAESSGFRRSRKKSQSRAKMILLLVIIFLVCFFPNHLFMIWFYYHPYSQSLYNDFWHVLRIVAFCLTFLNSTLNPLTLYLTSDQFKKLFNKYLLGCLVRSSAFPVEVSDPSTVAAESPPPKDTCTMKHNDKNQNQKNGGKTCFYRETVFQPGTNPPHVDTNERDRDRFGGVFVGDSDEERVEVGRECPSCRQADSESVQAGDEGTTALNELQSLLTGSKISNASTRFISSTSSLTESESVNRALSARSHYRRSSAASERARFSESIPSCCDQRTK